MASRSRLSSIVQKTGWIFASKVLLSLVAIVLAASISVTMTTRQAEIGSVVSYQTGLLATDKGFSASPTAGALAGTSCSSPVTFAAFPSMANTTIIAGHLVYDVQVNATGAPTNHQWNVTLMVGSTTYGPLCIQTLSITTGTIDCRFDVGTSLPSSPYTFRVTVQ